jgi:hypothetical protein
MCRHCRIDATRFGNCTLLSYYVACSGNPYWRFGATYRSHLHGSRLITVHWLQSPDMAASSTLPTSSVRRLYYLNNNQHGALFIFSLLSYHTSTCFGCISSRSSGGRMYIRGEFYLLYFWVDCHRAWGQAGWQSTVQYNKYDLPHTYILSPDEGLLIARNMQRCDKLINWRETVDRVDYYSYNSRCTVSLT